MRAASTVAPPGAAAAPSLPQLRAELQMADGPVDAEGRPGVLIVDPVRNAYFRLAWPASAAVRHWRGADAEALSRHLAQHGGVSLTAPQLREIADFLFKNELTTTDRNNSWQELSAAQTPQGSLLTRAAHTYLFLRIPLLNPDRALQKILPLFGFVFTRAFVVTLALMLVSAGYMILRQWDSFAANAARMWSIEALPAYAALLFALKCVHEFGHALVARRHGCHVPTMGLALMVGVPVLYTDTTDTWRLTERWKRLSVVLAGVGAEMCVATVALLAWSFLPEGAPRQMAFALATMSIVTSLTLNLNPCMRFDGYFALSDILDVPNLQDRAFALTRSHLRSVLFGLAGPAAPDLPRAKMRALVIYGYATWLYRVVLYVGIAALVYMMSFKLLGLALFAFEVIYFLIRPLWSEAKAWWEMRGEVRMQPRARLTLAIALAAVVLVLLPWNRVVEAPAVLAARDEVAVHARAPARIVEVLVQDGMEVAEGAVLMRLEAPALEAQSRRVQAEIAALAARRARAPAMDSERDAGLVIETQLRAAQEKRAALERLAADLDVRAPRRGIVVDLDPGLRRGAWINHGQELARIVAPSGVSVRGLIDETDIRRIADGATAVFISDTGLRAPLALRVVSVAESNERQISEPILSDLNGGAVATLDDHNRLAPRASLFGVVLESNAPAPLMLERGTVRIAAAGQSPVFQAFRRVMQVLTRESGF